jgi:cytochrome c peroxidase
VLQLFAPIPAGIPDVPGNAMTPEKIELGRMLFFEPRLWSSWLISCNTCHNMGLAGVDLLETSVGAGCSPARATGPACWTWCSTRRGSGTGARRTFGNRPR